MFGLVLLIIPSDLPTREGPVTDSAAARVQFFLAEELGEKNNNNKLLISP